MPTRTDSAREATELSRRQVLARLGLAASVAYAAPALFTLSEARASGGTGGDAGGTGGDAGGTGGAGDGGAAGGTTPGTAPIIPPIIAPGGTP